jgi:glutathione S-transferase
MFTLYLPPPALGLPSLSPACAKLATWVRMTGIPHRVAPFDLAEAPKGKVPYIRTEEGQTMGDSTLIVEFLKQRYGKDPDAHLSRAERAVSLAFRRMLKENDYWVIIQTRYKMPDNWRVYRMAIASAFPPEMPEEARLATADQVHKDVTGQMYGHGMGRHTAEEVFHLGIQDLGAVADYLGDKPFFMGAEPTTVDATIYAHVANILLVPFASPVRDFGLAQPNLVAHCHRMGERFFPELAGIGVGSS